MQGARPAPPRPADRARRGPTVLIYRGIGVTAVALAAVGVALPLVPTTPLLLVAVWAFARSTPSLADRLRAHRLFGPHLQRWEERRAIARPAKAAAVLGMTGSWALLSLSSGSPLIAGVVGVVMLAAGVYVVTRPPLEPEPSRIPGEPAGRGPDGPAGRS